VEDLRCIAGDTEYPFLEFRLYPDDSDVEDVIHDVDLTPEAVPDTSHPLSPTTASTPATATPQPTPTTATPPTQIDTPTQNTPKATPPPPATATTPVKATPLIKYQVPKPKYQEVNVTKLATTDAEKKKIDMEKQNLLHGNWIIKNADGTKKIISAVCKL